MKNDVAARLEKRGIQASAQRLAVAGYVLTTEAHPTADQVWAEARRALPAISRATVYNTLHLFAEKGLLRELTLAGGRVVYDPNVDRHHHFVDDDDGSISDIPWDALRVRRVEKLPGVKVRDYAVVVHGRKARRERAE
jgi:Fe2+ or Zn2+ uptake regulation protein